MYALWITKLSKIYVILVKSMVEIFFKHMSAEHE